VEEETGFDMSAYISPEEYIQVELSGQVVTMFICMGVPESTRFETQTRKEIGVSGTRTPSDGILIAVQAIEWVKLTDLPTWLAKKSKTSKRFYNVVPFVW
jgi:hypothetical protein